jgi:oligopeptide/dipeptide ABC transporter ATP-binding protein
MYAGLIVEEAQVDMIYEDARHPYTQALLEALPRIDLRREKRLKSIPGAPPNLLAEPQGCPFAPRCEYVIERCRQENPPLEPIAPRHKIACWVDHTGRRMEPILAPTLTPLSHRCPFCVRNLSRISRDAQHRLRALMPARWHQLDIARGETLGLVVRCAARPLPRHPPYP